jgi:hypothetical protein
LWRPRLKLVTGPVNRARDLAADEAIVDSFSPSLPSTRYATPPSRWSASARPQVSERRQDGVLVAAGHLPVTGINLDGRGSRGPARLPPLGKGADVAVTARDDPQARPAASSDGARWSQTAGVSGFPWTSASGAMTPS